MDPETIENTVQRSKEFYVLETFFWFFVFIVPSKVKLMMYLLINMKQFQSLFIIYRNIFSKTHNVYLKMKTFFVDRYKMFLSHDSEFVLQKY